MAKGSRGVSQSREVRGNHHHPDPAPPVARSGASVTKPEREVSRSGTGVASATGPGPPTPRATRGASSGARVLAERSRPA
jgi:hypothetical protein